MTNITITNIIKYTTIISLALIPFTPLYIANPLFFPFITGKAFAFRILVEIAFALWLVLLLRQKGTTVIGTDKSVVPRINLMTIFVTIFALIVLVADLVGLNPLRSIWSNFERMEGWMTIIHLWAYFIVLSSVLKTGENWSKFFNVVLTAGAITALYGLFQFFGWADIHQGSTRVDASLGNSAYMAVYMLINAFIAGYMAVDVYMRSHKPLIWIYSIATIFFSFIMFQTATRGTILGWLVAIIIACAIYAIFGRSARGQSGKSRAIAGGFLVLVILIGILFYFNRDAQWIQKNEVLGRIASISISDTKTQARGFVWPMAVNGVFESVKTAIIGVGQENFNYIFNKNYDPRMWAHEQWFDRAHSVYLDWLVAGGVLGLGLYLVLYIVSLIYIIKSDLTIGQKSIMVGLLVGYAIHNIFVFDNQTSYIMFFTFLAFAHSLRPGKTYSWLGASAETPSEDSITVRDYIFIPIIVIAFIASLYFINIRPIQANTRFMGALRLCSEDNTKISIESFVKALKLNQTVANQEIREHMYNCAGNVIRGNAPERTKVDFYNLAKAETEKQIASSPNDSRVYIISGTFFSSIGDHATALPFLQKAVEFSPAKQSIIFELASNYLNSERKEEALDLMEKAYFSSTDNETAKIGYIVALISAGEEKRAKELFGNQPELFEDIRVINAYIEFYISQKQYAKAITILKTVGEKFPDLKAQADTFIKQIQEGTVKL
ncbi:MAG TPA: tetratricopeptide repeat protein [Candidatus Paceibacterota bacterium]